MAATLEHPNSIIASQAAPAADPAPRWVWNGRIPCLDGLRAVAIFIVLAEHAHRTAGFPWNWDHTVMVALTVGLGPNIFFVISGFLITLLFLRESQRTGTISIKGFYSRRIMRLTPVFAIFVLTIF